MSRPRSSSTLILAIDGCKKVQAFLESLIAASVRIKRIKISMPSDVYYAVRTFMPELSQDYPFLDYPQVTLVSNQYCAERGYREFKFSLTIPFSEPEETAPVKPKDYLSDLFGKE